MNTSSEETEKWIRASSYDANAFAAGQELLW